MGVGSSVGVGGAGAEGRQADRKENTRIKASARRWGVKRLGKHMCVYLPKQIITGFGREAQREQSPWKGNREGAGDVIVCIRRPGDVETKQAEEVHHYIRELINELYNQEVADNIIIQYGGSVKPSNTNELLTQHDIDGALIGGASLDLQSFLKIIKITNTLS